MEVKGALAAVIAIICLLAGIGIGYGVGTVVAPKPTGPTGPALTGTLKIGGLIELTGDLGPWGPMYRAALELAESDINAWLEDIGAGFKIDILIEDVESNPTVCLDKVKALYAEGVRFFVGPTSSAELSAIKDYCDSNQLLVISHASTALSLAVEDDFIFRACPNDAAQSLAIAKMIEDVGVEHLIILYRNDDWGRGLMEAVTRAYGGDIYDTIPYTEKPEYTTEVSTLNSKVSDAVSTYGADKVGVLAISFGEIATIVQTAKSYPTLSQVKWFGCDGFVMCTELLDPAVVDFVNKTGMVCTVFAPTKSPKFEHVRDYIYRQVGEEPDAYAYPLYDAVWLIVLSVLEAQSFDPVKVKDVLPKVAENYFGATGWMKMNAAGDKEASDYDLCAIVQTPTGDFEWEYVGKWDYATNTIIWTVQVYG